MLTVIQSACLLGAMALVGAPLCYAIETLNRLQHKRFYPVLRFIEHNGHVSSIEVPLS